MKRFFRSFLLQGLLLAVCLWYFYYIYKLVSGNNNFSNYIREDHIVDVYWFLLLLIIAILTTIFVKFRYGYQVPTCYGFSLETITIVYFIVFWVATLISMNNLPVWWGTSFDFCREWHRNWYNTLQFTAMLLYTIGVISVPIKHIKAQLKA